jgi:general secretion pathway protein N
MTRDRQLALALGAVAALLAVFGIAQRAGIGSGYALAPAVEQTEPTPSLAGLDREQVKLRPYVDYGEMLARPIFNESRAPEIQETAAVDPNAPAAQPLNVQLAGIILTGAVKLAMVTDPGNGETQRVKLGMPLEGAQSAWTLVELKPRAAVFDGAGLGRTELELSVDTKGAVTTVPPPTPAPSAALPPATPALTSNTPVPADPNAAPAANADEIRRRIEERRRQLREEAQRMLDQQNQNQNQ